jgi:peptide/nickel transport system permease protein
VPAPSPRFLVRRTLSAAALVFAVTSGALLLAQLDRPLLDQYVTWLSRSFRFDLGESFQYQRPVLTLVRERAANTIELAATALVLATAIGIPCGIVTGSRRRGALRSTIRLLSLILLSLPPLITSLLLVTMAARTGWLPASGMGGPEHLVIPALALALPLAAMLERLQAESLREALQQPSTMAARARGVPLHRIVWHHAWRQSLGPILALYGVIAGSLFSGSFAVELVTSWPGLGLLMRGALMTRDTYLIAGCAAAGAVFLAAGILAADVAHAALDPRAVAEPTP